MNSPHSRADHPQAQAAEQLITEAKSVADVYRASPVGFSGERSRAQAFGPADGVRRAVARGLDGEPQTGAPPLSGGTTAEAHTSPAEAPRPADGSLRPHLDEHPHQVWA